MTTSSEQISNYYTNSGGRPDSNLANDALHLGGVPAEDFATLVKVQEYVENLNNTLKQYIDTQDVSYLQQAKAYTDYMISNQDFSSFAKLIDVQAVSDNLTTLINQKNTEQKQYVDGKVAQVVSDTNANFQDVNAAVTNLSNSVNSRMNELFQSVSNGKAQIAGAITGKGVSTSANATFSQMATNISNIPQSGGGGGTDTSDATATASDILLGKTAYAKGQKLYGQLVAPNSHEDNPDNPYPTHDEVEIVYGVVPGEMSVLTTTFSYPSGKWAMTSSRKNIVRYNNDKIEILTYKDGTYKKITNISGSTGQQTNKNEYTLSELGISLNEDTEICNIRFSAMNNKEDESAYYCMLAICVRRKSLTLSEDIPSYTVYLYKFNGEILTENETGTGYKLLNKYIITTTETAICQTCDVAFHTDDMRKLVINEYIKKYNDSQRDISKLHIIELYKYEMFNEDYYEKDVINAAWTGSAAMGKYLNNISNIQYLNDRLITYDDNNDTINSNGGGTRICILNEYSHLIKRTQTTPRTALTEDGLYAIKYDCKFYSVTTNYTTGDVSLSPITDTAILSTSAYTQGTSIYGSNIPISYFDKSRSYLIIANSSGGLAYYIESFDQTTQLELLKQASASGTVALGDHKSFIINDGSLKIIYPFEDRNIIAGLKYKGNMYYSNVYEQGLLTAGQPDVRAGKTFIGYMGVPETGTMEVSE